MPSTTNLRKNMEKSHSAEGDIMTTEFTVRLSGIAVRIRALYPETYAFCRDYLTREEPRLWVETTPEDIELERERSVLTAQKENRAPGAPPAFYLETLAVYRKLAEQLIDYDTILFHGSVIAVDGEGYLFTAPSGTGKSTHARLWRKLLGDRAFMVNDDKPLLTVKDGEITAWGTPWDGKHHLSRNTSVPLRAVCLLSQAGKNHIEPAAAADMWPALWAQTYRPERADRLVHALSLVERLAFGASLYRLSCNMEMEAAEISYQAMAVDRK